MATFTILEPMSTGDVIDRAVRLYRRNFTPLVAITAVPTLIGYVVSLMFWYGYTSLLTGAAGSGNVPITALWMLVLGGLGYPVWMFALLLTVSGLCRVVGDHLMLGEPITFRGCFRAVKRRLGAITLMGLLSVALLFAAYVVISIVVIVLALAVGLIVGVIAAAQLPQWIATVTLALTVIVAVAAGLLLICVVASRIVFLPQIVMIEGASAGNALGRAMRLGKGNWYRVAAIVIFTYFVSLSLLAALTLPVLLGLYLSGVLSTNFFLSPAWSILYTSFRDISSLLSLPIWIVSFTLLYFDSRVRKEAYDVDLMAREINPGFYWQPAVQTSAFGYQVPAQFAQGRAYVQTSPLGLAGYYPPQPRVEAASTGGSAAPRAKPDELRDKFERAAESLSGRDEAGRDRFETVGDSREVATAKCKACGAALLTGASFCMNCGSVAQVD
ncbi:MAG: zinc ribbon domain-containing protein [Acidobacteriota bacterium]